MLKEIIENFDVRTPSALIPVGSLSGGNQQKVIVGREFSRPIKFLVASQPTRGSGCRIDRIYSQPTARKT